ncbi:MAG: AraC family transcriptional regulator [Verrucomicrobiota bacterium]|nr:AraC family transcriptional regulator [Verrucomicrobiota bacterium]
MPVTTRYHCIPTDCVERYLDLRCAGAYALQEAGFTFSGISKLVYGYHISTGYLSEMHLVLMTLEGAGTLRTEKNIYIMEKGDLLMVPKGLIYEYFVTGNAWNIAWCFLQDIPAWNVLRVSQPLYYKSCDTTSLVFTMEGYLTESSEMNNARAVDLYAGLVVHHLNQLINKYLGSHCLADERTIDMLWRQVMDAPGQPWDLASMAQRAGMSISTFQRNTKKKYHFSPHKLILQIRMDHARLLLESTQYPVKFIAGRVGYSDEFTFSTAFKHTHGLPPAKWRTETKLKHQAFQDRINNPTLSLSIQVPAT